MTDPSGYFSTSLYEQRGLAVSTSEIIDLHSTRVFSPALCAMMGLKTESHPLDDKIPDLSPDVSPYDVFFTAPNPGTLVGEPVPPFAMMPAQDGYRTSFRASSAIGQTRSFIAASNTAAAGSTSKYAHQLPTTSYANPTSTALPSSYPMLMPIASSSRSLAMRSAADTTAATGFYPALPPPAAVWRPQQSSAAPTIYPPPTVGVKRPLVTTSTILPKGSRTPKRSRAAGAPPTPGAEGRGYKFGLSVKAYGTQIQHIESAANTLGVDPQELVRYVLQSRINGITKQDVRPFCS